jgi:hypothetical protein
MLYHHGPCVRVLFCNTEYDASSHDDNKQCTEAAPAGSGHRDNDLQLLIMDNHTADGPKRWVPFCQFDELFVLKVAPLKTLTKKRKRPAHADSTTLC